MTAVASPPSFQPLSRLGWNSNNGPGSSQMSSEEVSRIFMPRKSVQRTNSSSSVSSSSSTSTVTSQPNQGSNSNGESSGWTGKKKGTRGIWPSSKSEAVAGVSNVRPQPVGTSTSGPPMSASIPASHQPSPVLPSQHALQSQANSGRAVNGHVQKEASAVLALLPLNGTFERKQINLPTWPEVLRVGRQTNAKTLPTPVNGFFDSKVLSRQHAEVWSDSEGRVYIKDVKSSNGTFVNGQRLSPESRESEPHQLREHDTLELGIDIVSEDQKTVVHHKVSAKVEFAGILGSATNVLDLNFGDMDPSTGASLLSSPLSQGAGRGRPGAHYGHGKMPSAQSIAGNQIMALQQSQVQRVRLNVEDLVKLLATEMKQARMSNQTLAHTDDFLQSVLKSGPEKEKQPQSANESNSSRHSSGKLKMPKIDPVARFSDPPAPPPQQPLPEKPDGTRSSPQEAHAPIPSLLKRSETERPRTGSTTSPTSTQSSQILSLVEALGLAKKEIDSQSARVRQLEDLLRQERVARENAEEKVRSMEEHPSVPTKEDTAATESQRNSHLEDDVGEENQAARETTMSEQLKAPSETNGVPPAPSPRADTTETDLQRRIDTMMAEIDEMKQQMEKYRSRAESAESEASSSRASLAEMVGKLRQEGSSSTREAIDSASGLAEAHARKSPKSPAAESISGSTVVESEGQRSPTSQGGKSLEHVVATILRDGRRGDGSSFAAQSAPYASILGVVLIGVGLMSYLNSYQKGDR